MFSRIAKYFFEIKKEMNKVSWLNSQELRGSTIVVLAFSIVVILFLFIVDLVITAIRGQIF